MGKDVALLDVEKTILFNDDLNQGLLDALQTQGIKDVYLFTDILPKYAAINAHEKLQKRLEKQGFIVHGVITPLDLVWDKIPAQEARSFQKYILQHGPNETTQDEIDLFLHNQEVRNKFKFLPDSLNRPLKEVKHGIAYNDAKNAYKGKGRKETHNLGFIERGIVAKILADNIAFSKQYVHVKGVLFEAFMQNKPKWVNHIIVADGNSKVISSIAQYKKKSKPELSISMIDVKDKNSDESVYLAQISGNSQSKSSEIVEEVPPSEKAYITIQRRDEASASNETLEKVQSDSSQITESTAMSQLVKPSIASKLQDKSSEKKMLVQVNSSSINQIDTSIHNSIKFLKQFNLLFNSSLARTAVFNSLKKFYLPTQSEIMRKNSEQPEEVINTTSESFKGTVEQNPTNVFPQPDFSKLTGQQDILGLETETTPKNEHVNNPIVNDHQNEPSLPHSSKTTKFMALLKSETETHSEPSEKIIDTKIHEQAKQQIIQKIDVHIKHLQQFNLFFRSSKTKVCVFESLKEILKKTDLSIQKLETVIEDWQNKGVSPTNSTQGKSTAREILKQHRNIFKAEYRSENTLSEKFVTQLAKDYTKIINDQKKKMELDNHSHNMMRLN